MKTEDAIKCKDGSTLSKMQIQLICEAQIDKLMGNLRKSLLEAYPATFDKVWGALPEGETGLETEQQAVKLFEANISLAVIMGLSDGLRATMTQVSTDLRSRHGQS